MYGVECTLQAWPSGYSMSGRGGRAPVELRRDYTVCFWFWQVVVVMTPHRPKDRCP